MSQSPAQNEATKKLLAKLWEKNLPLLRERLAQLEAAASTLTPESRSEAASTAHKLAGSLGMFGYPKGTELARELEIFFDGHLVYDGSASRLVRELRSELGID